MEFPERPGRPFIDETLLLVGRALGASRLAFYGVDERQNLCDFVYTGVPAEFHRLYEREMFASDPLHVRRLAGLDGTIARMAEADRFAPPAHVRRYRAFLRRFSTVDTIELVFRDERGIYAGLNVTWLESDPPPTAASLGLAAQLQRYIDYNLTRELARRADSWSSAAQSCGLTSREREVAELIRRGYTNAAIAKQLGVQLSTIKTHLIHIYEKCQVDTRAGLVGRLHGASHSAGTQLRRSCIIR